MPTKRPIPFRGFDDRADVPAYQHGLLPHWRQLHCTYFVTFRQDDALPAAVVREIDYDRQKWLKHRGIDPADEDWRKPLAQLPGSEQRIYERMIGTKLNRELDAGYGSCRLRKKELASVVATALEHFHGQRVLTGDYVVMPNHVHVLMRPLPNHELEGILHSIKSFTANEINRLSGHDGQFWQRQSYDHIVRDLEQLEAFRKYIRANPERARLKDGEFLYSSAEYVPDE